MKHVHAILLSASVIAATPWLPDRASAQSARTDVRLQKVEDRFDILELSARFDNSLDSEDAVKFISVFGPDGILEGFWGQSKGPEQLRQSHAFMISTFAKDKRHVVTNHEITIDGDRAKMFSYLTVFDRKALAVTGTATFSDELVRRNGEWKFTKRVLLPDPNVDPIIAGLTAKKQQ